MANWFCGGWLSYRSVEISASALAPSVSKSSETDHLLVCGSRTAVAFVTCVPLMKVGWSRYLAVPSRSQVANQSSRTSGWPARFSGKVQSRRSARSWNSVVFSLAWTGVFGCFTVGLALGLALGLAVAESDGAAEGEGASVGLADGAGGGVSRRRAGLRRPSA